MRTIQYIAVISASLLYTDAFSVGRGRRSVVGNKESHGIVRRIPSPFSKSALKDKWDDLVDEDEIGDPLWQVRVRFLFHIALIQEFILEVILIALIIFNLKFACTKGPPIPKDMRYIVFNLMRQNKNFEKIRAAGGAELTNDIYVRDPDTDVFWFAGKVARIDDVSVEKAVARQYPLMEEHAARLRPRELFSKNGLLQLWAAPGDSEMDVAYNRPAAKFIQMHRAHEVEGADDVRNVEVGFQGEIYEVDEEGFRSQRTEDGLPLNPEIQPEGEQGIPTGEDINQIIDTSATGN